MKSGKVYLVGAGPGDPNLITRKALECLAQADVIVFDRLLDEKLLDSAPLKAEKIYVGKSTEEHAREQVEINQLLVEKAKDGKSVVRLKGGDPFVLGRGGEEAEALEANGILFEIVPGISSAIAVPAYAGIPVTHRGLASSFAVITGHEDPGKDSSSINWKNLAVGIDTLVFLMGMKNLPEIVAKLVENGRPHDTPIAIIQNGTKPTQKTLIGSLNNIIEKVNEYQFGPPAIAVVGEVVRLREKLRWFDNRPLFGKRILVTRARHQASGLSKLFTDRGAQPIELPVIAIQNLDNNEELDQALSDLKYYQWIAFTSINGVVAFFQRLRSLQLDIRALNGLKIGAIGPATARSLQAMGIIPDYVPEVHTGQGFIAGLNNHDIAGQRFMLPRADIADKELAEGINKLGAEAHEIVSYRTVPVSDTISQVKDMLSSGKFDAITFTSSSTVTNLVAAFKGERPSVNSAKVACIGPKTSETAVRAGLKVDIVASEHTIPGLVEAIENYYIKEI